MFAVLYGAVEIILLSVPSLRDPTVEVIAWHAEAGNRALVVLAFNLAAFAAIAFVWFVAVLRRRLGDRADEFYGTVFLASGILFVALYLTGLGVRIALAAGFLAGERVPDTGDLAVVHGASQLILVVAMPRMQAMFVAVASTIGRRAGGLPGWLTAAGYLFALALAIVPWIFEVPGLGFGLWVALVSGSLLIRRKQAG